MSEHEPSARTLAFDAVVALALEAVESDRGRYYGADIETPDVLSRVDGDVSKRTVLRACKDAAALGWVTDERRGWDPGPRAERYASDS